MLARPGKLGLLCGLSLRSELLGISALPIPFVIVFAGSVRPLAELSPDFLQTVPRETALVVWTRGSPLSILLKQVKADVPTRDFHPIRSCPCRAYSSPFNTV